MRGTFHRLLSILLCVVLLVCVSPAAAAAQKDYFRPEVNAQSRKSYTPLQKALLEGADKAVFGALNAVSFFKSAPPAWTKKSAYRSAGFLPGQTDFQQNVSPDAVWSLGYARASLLEGQNVLDGKHFVGGTPGAYKSATAVLDDLIVRTVALNDGTGRGTAVFVMLDCYGICATDVRAIRMELSDFCAQHNIVSLNIGALHQHSAVDTFGLNGSIGLALLCNWFVPYQLGLAPINGRNSAYMRNLYNKTIETVKSAVTSMQQGKLYFSTVAADAYVKDKRAPYVLDRDLNVLHFVPDAPGAADTYLTTYTAHCVGHGAGGREITGDYPYYIEKELAEKSGSNFMLILGAEQGTTPQADPGKGDGVADGTVGEVDESNPVGYPAALGRTLAQLILQKGGDSAVEVPPLLNIAHAETFFPIRNSLLLYAGKRGMLANTIVYSGTRYEVVSEIGYMELGDKLAFALIPGELAAELAYGGCLPASESWRGTEWTIPSMQQTTGTRELLILGLMNDQIGYIIPENDYMPAFAADSQTLEYSTLGDHMASAVTTEYAALLNSIRK